MTAHQGNGQWIPLMDYAMKKGVSLSTLRRYIKSNKIDYKTENGRYLIWDDETSVSVPAPAGDPAELRTRLRKAQEEIAELKMLIAIYEEQLSRKSPAVEF